MNAKADSELERWVTAIKKEFGSPHLPSLHKWERGAMHAIESKIGMDDYVTALSELLSDSTRIYPVTPDNVLTKVLQDKKKSPQTKPSALRPFKEILAEQEANRDNEIWKLPSGETISRKELRERNAKAAAGATK